MGQARNVKPPLNICILYSSERRGVAAINQWSIGGKQTWVSFLFQWFELHLYCNPSLLLSTKHCIRILTHFCYFLIWLFCPHTRKVIWPTTEAYQMTEENERWPAERIKPGLCRLRCLQNTLHKINVKHHVLGCLACISSCSPCSFSNWN